MGVLQIGVRVSASSGSAKNIHRRSLYLLLSYHLICSLFYLRFLITVKKEIRGLR